MPHFRIPGGLTGAPSLWFGWQPFWKLVFGLLLTGGVTALGAYVFSPDWITTGQDLPTGLHSPLKANYAADPANFSAQPLEENILADALQAHSAQDASKPAVLPTVQLATLVAALRSPVPSITPGPGATAITTTAANPSQPSTPTASLVESTPTVTATVVATTPTEAAATATKPLPTARPTQVIPTATEKVNTAVPTQPEPTQTALPRPTVTSPAEPTAVKPTDPGSYPPPDHPYP